MRQDSAFWEFLRGSIQTKMWVCWCETNFLNIFITTATIVICRYFKLLISCPHLVSAKAVSCCERGASQGNPFCLHAVIKLHFPYHDRGLLFGSNTPPRLSPSYLNSELAPLDVIPTTTPLRLLEVQTRVKWLPCSCAVFLTLVLKTRWLAPGPGFIKSHPACRMRSFWARPGVSDLRVRGLSARAPEISQRLLLGRLTLQTVRFEPIRRPLNGSCY